MAQATDTRLLNAFFVLGVAGFCIWSATYVLQPRKPSARQQAVVQPKIAPLRQQDGHLSVLDAQLRSMERKLDQLREIAINANHSHWDEKSERFEDCVEPIRIAITLQLQDEGADAEFKAAMASMALSASCPIVVHLIHEVDNTTAIKQLVSDVTSPGVQFHLYPHSDRELVDRFKALNVEQNHHSGTFGLAKYFLPELLPDVHGELLLVDIDMLFLADVCKLRRYLDETQIFATPVFGKGYNNICSCIFVIHLDRARAIDWSHLPTKLSVKSPVPGDQYIFYAVRVHAEKNKLTWATELSNDWDVEGCHGFKTHNFTGVLHYNCFFNGRKPDRNSMNGLAFYYWHKFPLQNLRMAREHWVNVKICPY
eukprot:TRINITY_DN17327_c0_g1_i1.p1 TRINITY_DN17327_c0_g1~~TRINITY_DN17327_c0_g1_i1.p1  ORF type:complete len:368 (+),score=28.75 TRINITY_DN17327_c0_g1_i1:69-1172(+)